MVTDKSDILWDLSQRSPGTFAAFLLCSLVITLLAYGAFPLLFSRMWKRSITQRKYHVWCYAVNCIFMILFQLQSEESTLAPYLLWTSVFTWLGSRNLQLRGRMEDYDGILLPDDPTRRVVCKTCGYKSTEYFEACPNCGKYTKEYVYEPPSDIPLPLQSPEASATSSTDPAPDGIRFCRRCGTRLLDGGKFCHKCGLAISGRVKD